MSYMIYNINNSLILFIDIDELQVESEVMAPKPTTERQAEATSWNYCLCHWKFFYLYIDGLGVKLKSIFVYYQNLELPVSSLPQTPRS